MSIADQLDHARFLVLDRELHFPENGQQFSFPCGLLISNLTFWVENETEIEEWCSIFLSHYERHGMIIFLGSMNDLLLFKLRFM